MPNGPLPIDAKPEPHVDAGWRAREAKLVQEMAGDLSRVRLLFLGDSLTQGWPPALFAPFFGFRNPYNLGITGDTTHTMLWRLQRSSLGRNLRPELIVLLVGTNNLWPGRRPEDIALGIATVLRDLQSRSPRSRILLVGLLPRGQNPTDPFRILTAQVNQLIAPCADNKSVFYADPGPMLLNGQGKLSDQITFDYLHPTWLGYAILAAGLEPHIHRLLGEPPIR